MEGLPMERLLDALERMIVKRRRKRLAKKLFERYQGVVQRGPFAGLQLSRDANISQAALGLKLFGLYELPVLERLITWSPCPLLINLGGGDGYFSIGMLKADLVDRAICFEMAPAGRRAIAAAAHANSVASRLEIHGEADATSFRKLLQRIGDAREGAIVLCDIEGAEFSLLDRPLLENLRGTRMIVELHDRLTGPQTGNQRAALLERVAALGQVEIVGDCPRPWQGIEALESLHDLDRALVTSEGRKILGEWLVVDKANPARLKSVA